MRRSTEVGRVFSRWSSENSWRGLYWRGELVVVISSTLGSVHRSFQPVESWSGAAAIDSAGR